MALRRWTLIDQSVDLNVGQFALPPEKSPGAARGCSAALRTLRGGLSDGVQSLRIDNGRLAFDVLPTRGLGIWKAWLGGRRLGWRSPVRGPVHPAFVPLGEPSGLGWLDGFDELLVRCGLESNGAPEWDDQGRLRYGLHGRIANRPAHYLELAVDDQSGEIRVTGAVSEARFLVRHLRLTTTISTRAGEPRIVIEDAIENLAETPDQAQILYHINFGPPLLDEGARVLVPARAIAPRDERAAEGVDRWSQYGPPTPGFAEQVYFFEPLAGPDGHTPALLRNAAGDLGATVRFDPNQLPCFTLWKNTGGLRDGCATGLEPASNFPNPRSFEAAQGRLIQLPPGGVHQTRLELAFHDGSDAVAAAEREATAAQGDTPPVVHPQPRPDWSAP